MIEYTISEFMLRASKFEFFLVNLDQQFAHVEVANNVVKGVNWSRVAITIEDLFPFDCFDFENSDFDVFSTTVPQRLVIQVGGGLKWDSEQVDINSWNTLLARGYAQLRNNIAHGNKAQLSAPFTHDRTLKFIQAGNALIDFIASDVLRKPDWFQPISFH